MQSGGFVSVRLGSAQCRVPVQRGISATAFTDLCRRAFPHFPAHSVVAALRDSDAKYEFNLVSQYPDEFADGAVYALVLGPANNTMADNDVNMGNEDGSPYVLYFENEDLGLTAPDVRLLKALVVRTHLRHTEFEDAVDIFRVATSGTPGLVPQRGFEAALRELIPADRVRNLAMGSMTRLFALTDRVRSGACDFGELVSAFSLFCAGSKSDKLSLAFRLLDTNQDGRITRRQLWRFLRSFLTVLFSLSVASLNEGVETLYTIIDDATVSIAQTVFAELADAGDGPRKSISFEEFGEWYNQGGFRMVPWLELLDLGKWPFAEVDELDDEEDEPAADAAKGAAASGEEPLLQFPLCAEDGLYLVLSPADVEAYNDLLTNTQLYLVEPFTIVNEFLVHEKQGTLSRADFEKVVRELCPVKPLSGKVQEALTKIFDAFEINDSNKVDMSSFLAGFLMLASGSKSDKLLLAFRLFDDDTDGQLNRRQMWTFLRSYLTILVAVSSCYDMPRASLNFLIDSGAIDACASVFSAEREQGGDEDKISFQEFGAWYNRGGFERVPWLELLDFAKWPSVGGSSEYSSSAAGSQASSAGDEADATGDGDEDDDDEDDDDLIFRFELDPKQPGTLLEVNTADVATVRRIVDAANLSEVRPSSIVELFEAAAGPSNVLTKPKFNSVVRRLIPGDNLSSDDKEFLSFALSNIFYAFDRNNDGTVDFDEFAAGFAMLASGSKSEKLQLAFRMFDVDGDGYISTLEMWRYLRSFLTVLLALNGAAQQLPTDRLVDLIDSAAVSITQQVFKTADVNRDNRISYAEFGNWYNDKQGYTMLPWLELLDMNKWPAPATSADAESDGSTEACFEFVLTADGHLLRIMPEDVRAFQRVTQSSTLDEVDVATLQRVFDEVAGDAPALTKAAFNRAVRALIPGQALSEDEQRFLSYMLSNLFFAFDADHNGAVDREEFTAGFLLLCSGNKSDKLSLAFRLFDTNGDGYLDREEMSRYLRAFLTSLAAMTALASDPQTPDIVDSSAAALADHIFETADLNRDNVISYEEFGTWYNEGGYRVLPWLELLDLKKWPEVPAEGEDDDGADATADDDDEPDLEAGRGAGAPTEEDDDEYSDDFESDEGSDDSEADGLVFEFDLTADEKLAITTGDCLRLVEITEASQLCTIMPAVVHETFLGEAHDAAITKAAFDAAVRKLVPGDSLTEEEKAFLTITLSNFYFAFDRDQQGYVDCDELAAGFTLFCAGNKSDKLSLAFLLFNDGDSGSLSQPELWRFLRSFLVALAAASHCRAPLEPEMVSEVLDQHAADMTARIFEESRAGRADPSTISYEELGTWYNEGGYAVLPWLELLDLSKWPEVDGSDDEGDDDEGDDNAASAANADDGEEDGDDDDDEDGYDDSDPLYQFLLSFKSQVMLEITALNVDTLAKVLVLSRLHNTDVQTLYTVLAEGSDEDGRITKSAFNRCMRSLIPGDGLDKDEQNFLSIVLSSIFFVFASGDDPYVDFVEFAAGFSLLVGGSKSDKLSQALRLFNMHGKLHERQLAAFLRAFLLALASVSTFVIRRTVDEVRELLTATSAELAELIFAESADDREESNTITYEEFGEWYNQGGYEVLPWLELLDLQKWPQASVEGEDDDEDDGEGDEQAATNGERHVGFNVEDDDDEDEDDDDDEDEDDDDDEDDEDDDGEDEQVMFAFPLSPAAADQAEDSDLLLITASDCRSLHALVTRSGLPTVSCDEVFTAFKSRASDSGTIDKEGFDSAVRSLVPSTSLSDEEKQFLSFALSRMFYAFASAADSVGKVQAVDLATGMTMLAGGNKSNKLLLAFNTYSSRGDAEDDTSVDASGLAGMLKCFLTMLLAVNSFNSDTTDVEPSSLKAASQRCATEIFKRIEPSGDTISYEDFGLWYNSGGFDVLPWLELLDVKKWPTGVLSSSDDDSYGAEENSEGSGDESELTDDENLADPAPGDGDGDDDGDDKGASSPARSRRLSFSRAIPAMVKARRTMSSINVQAMHAEFLAEANEDGVLDRDGFAAVVERIIPMEAIPAPEDRVFVKFTLDNVFSTFDRDGDGFVDYDEFCAGMGMLAGDSRSQKVQLAFSLMDEDGDGSITRHELWKTLRSFLTTLAAMDPGKHKLDMKQRRKLHVAIDRRAKEAMEAVFRDADTNHDEMITYDEWEAWYSVHGAAELPWVHALEHAAAAVTAPPSPQRNRTRSEEDMGIELTPLAHEEHKAGGAFDDDFQIAVTAHGYDDIAVTGADLSHASALRATTGLGSVPVEQLRQTLAEAAGADNRLTLAAFSKAMKQFAPAGASSTAAADAGAKTLTALFTAFDVHSAGVASLGDVVTGLSVLCTGGLNDRVQALVAVYDLDEDNKISRRETFSMIQALATVLVALRVLRRNETFDRAVRQQVFKFAANVNEVAFKEADTDKDGMLSLDELRAWMSAQVNSDDEGSVWLRTLMQL